MAGWQHRLDGHEFEWTPGVGERQGGLVCCSPWGRKELYTTERLNWTELLILSFFVSFQREVDFIPSILGKKILQQIVFFNGEINSMAEKYSLTRTLQVALRQYLGYCDFIVTRTQLEHGEGATYDLTVKHSWVKFQSVRFLIFWVVTARISLVTIYKHIRDFPGGASGKEPTCQCRRPKRHWFDPWVKKIPRKRTWQPTPGFFPGESHGQTSLAGYSP